MYYNLYNIIWNTCIYSLWIFKIWISMMLEWFWLVAIKIYLILVFIKAILIFFFVSLPSSSLKPPISNRTQEKNNERNTSSITISSDFLSFLFSCAFYWSVGFFFFFSFFLIIFVLTQMIKKKIIIKKKQNNAQRSDWEDSPRM